MTIEAIYCIREFSMAILFGRYNTSSSLFSPLTFTRVYADCTTDNLTRLIRDSATGFVKLVNCKADAVCTVDDIVEIVHIWDDVSECYCPLLNKHWNI